MNAFKALGVKFVCDTTSHDSFGRPTQYASEDRKIIVYKINTIKLRPWRANIDGATIFSPKMNKFREFAQASGAAIAAVKELRERGVKNK